MKRAFIIECDSDMSTVFLYEATVVLKEGEWIAERGEKIVNAYPEPAFYGVLDSLLITSERIKKVTPVTPEPAERTWEESR